MFIPLHNHTHYSLLDGLSTIPEYVKRLQEIGATAGAVTDHGTCGGLEDFQYYIQSNNIDIKPIFGIETYFVDDVNDRFSDRVVRDSHGEVKRDKKTGEPLREKLRPSDFNHGCMWAQNDEGLRNLFTLSTLAYRDGQYYKPRIDMKMLKEHGRYLFVSDGCMLSAVSKAIVADEIDRAIEWEQKLIDAVGRENVLVELHTWQFTDPELDRKESRYQEYLKIYDQLSDLAQKNPDDNEIAQKRMQVKSSLDVLSSSHRSWQLNHDMRKTNRGKIDIARRLGLRMIAVNDSHYSQRSDWKWHELEWETTTKKKDLSIQDDKTEGRGETASWVMSEDECREWLIRNDVPESVAQEAIDNTAWVADHCSASIHYGMVPPRFLESREADERLFRDELEKGFKELVPKGEEKRYRERLEMEVELILKCDLSAYFLIVSNYANFVRDDDVDGSKYGVEGKHSSLLGPGRGSCGGSLVCYLLHITNVDPLVFNLYFERFLTAGRVISSVHVHFDDGSDERYAPDDFVTLDDGRKIGSWELLDSSRTLEDGRTIDSTSFDFRDCPDIDLDFESTIIPKFDEYIVHRYGQWNYCSIGTFQTLKLASAINDVARTTDVDREDAQEMINEIRKTGWPMDDEVPSHDLSEFIETTKGISSVQRLYRNTDFWQKVWTWGGRFRSRGIHASGYIISKESLLGMIPLRWDQKAEKLVSEWDHWGVGRVGLIKFDILKLSHLNTIRQTYAATHGGKVDISEIYRMMRDERLLSFRSVWKPTWKGDTTAIFQMDTTLGSKTAMNAQIRSLRDAGLLSAVNRPGMVQSGAINHFYKVRQGKEDRPEYHPMIDDILDESNGFIVYQEQIMNIFARLTHMTMGETDNVRKIIAKKQKEKMPALEERLRRYCRNDPEFVRQVPDRYRNVDDCLDHMWNDIVSAGNYCFNKSHAQSYGMITSAEELLKVSAPREFVTAALNTNPEDTSLIIYAKTHDIPIMPPNVNTSVIDYELKDGSIYMPISAIKGVGGVAAREIAQAQPFRDFDDYYDRTSGRGGRKKTVLESLIQLGAFDGVDPRSRFDLMCHFKEMRGEDLPVRNMYDNARIRGSIETKLLGISLSYDPILDAGDWLRESGKTTQADVLETEINGWVSISGQITAMRRLTTKKGDDMAFVTLKLYDHSDMKITFFPSTWAKNSDMISTRDIVSVKCKRNEDFNGSPSFIAFSLKNHSLEEMEG